VCGLQHTEAAGSMSEQRSPGVNREVPDRVERPETQ
jgi:rubredoxin